MSSPNPNANLGTVSCPATTVRLLNRISDVSADDWDRLWPEHNPFLRHGFLSAMEDSGSADPDSGWAPCHLLLEHEGRAVAGMPLYRKSHSYGEFVFDWAWADAWQRHGLAYYPKLVSAVPFTPSAGPRIGLAAGWDQDALTRRLMQAMHEQLDGEGASSWHGLFPDAPSCALLQASDSRLLERHDVQFHWFNRDFDHFEAFLMSLRSSRRKNVRRERRRVAAQQVQLRRRVGDEIDEAAWDAFYRCYRATFLKRSGHGGYLTREFFTLLRERLASQLMLTEATQEGEVVAGALFLFDRNTLYGRWWGCLAELDCLHFEACFYQGIEFAIDQGLQRFDPGTQGEHKLLRGFEPVTTQSLHYIADPRFRQAVAGYVAEEREHRQRYGAQAAAYLPFRRDQDLTDQTGVTERPDRAGRNTDESA